MSPLSRKMSASPTRTSPTPANTVVNIVAPTGTSPPSSPASRPTQRDDLEFGTKSELTNHEILEHFLNTTLNRKGGYATFDFEDPTKTVFVELKTRRIKHDAYPTTMIGLNKIQFCELERDVDYWFAYCYTDGIWVIKYDRELFSNFEVSHDFKRSERPDARNNADSVVYIPIQYLTNVNPRELVMHRPPVGGAGASSE